MGARTRKKVAAVLNSLARVAAGALLIAIVGGSAWADCNGTDHFYDGYSWLANSGDVPPHFQGVRCTIDARFAQLCDSNTPFSGAHGASFAWVGLDDNNDTSWVQTGYVMGGGHTDGALTYYHEFYFGPTQWDMVYSGLGSPQPLVPEPYEVRYAGEGRWEVFTGPNPAYTGKVKGPCGYMAARWDGETHDTDDYFVGSQLDPAEFSGCEYESGLNTDFEPWDTSRLSSSANFVNAGFSAPPGPTSFSIWDKRS